MPTRTASFSALRTASLASRSSLVRNRAASLMRWKSSWPIMRDASGFSTGMLGTQREWSVSWSLRQLPPIPVPLRSLPGRGNCLGCPQWGGRSSAARSHPRAIQEAPELGGPNSPGQGEEETQGAVKVAAGCDARGDRMLIEAARGLRRKPQNIQHGPSQPQ